MAGCNSLPGEEGGRRLGRKHHRTSKIFEWLRRNGWPKLPPQHRKPNKRRCLRLSFLFMLRKKQESNTLASLLLQGAFTLTLLFGLIHLSRASFIQTDTTCILNSEHPMDNTNECAVSNEVSITVTQVVPAIETQDGMPLLHHRDLFHSYANFA